MYAVCPGTRRKMSVANFPPSQVMNHAAKKQQFSAKQTDNYSYFAALYQKNRHMEIERKFLLTGDFKTDIRKSMRISQGYLCSVPERTVRIRVRDDQGFITIKGKGDADGISRFEWEKEIPVNDALQILQLCEPGIIDKTRHLVDFGGHTFEVDEFHGDNEGLVMAEIELTSPDEPFDKPSWLGKEVTGDARYYNSALSRNPYKNW